MQLFKTMGSLIRVWKTIPMPVGATVSQDGIVTWTARGKKRIGKLSPTGNVSMQVDTWTAQFTDETGKTRKVPTKTTVRSIAEKIQEVREGTKDAVLASQPLRRVPCMTSLPGKV